MLAYITGTVDQELLARNEYLVTENRILKRQLKGRLVLSDAERATLGEIGHRLGRKALADVANAAKPDTILGWYRRLVARKFSRANSMAPNNDVTPVVPEWNANSRSWWYGWPERIATGATTALSAP
jgi:hypothetical protein